MGLTGARVLVVGASAGIGREIGLAATRAGATVAFAARRKDRLEHAVADAGSGIAVVLDVTEPPSVERGIELAARELGGLDVVAYASGVASIAPLSEETEENWRRTLATNVIGAATVAKVAIPHLSRDGLLFFTSSSNTYRRLWGLSAYGASKAALDRLIDGLRDEHPTVRMVRATIGQTVGTEFGDAFDGQTLADAMPRWIVGGQQTATMMSCADVGEIAAGILGLLRTYPTIDMPHVELGPAGGQFTLPPTADLLTQFFGSVADEG